MQLFATAESLVKIWLEVSVWQVGSCVPIPY